MNFSGKRVLITGASGFIGSFLVERALELGAEVWAAVRPSSSRRYLSDPRIRFIELNLSSAHRLREQLCSAEPWHYVFHAAGVTKCTDEADFARVNTEGTRLLAELLMETGRLLERFVYFSSLSVFGPVRQVPTGGEGNRYEEIADSDEPQPDSAYGRSKLAAEAVLARIPELDFVVLRPTGVYGPRERDYYLMAKSIKSHVDFAVGFKPQEITFIYVRDLVEAAFLACNGGPSRRAYFLTDGGYYDSRTFSSLLQRAMGVRFVLRVTSPLWFLRVVCRLSGALARMRGKASTLNMDKYRILSQRNWRCNIRPARELLGYEPHYSLERGVEETIKWYKQEGWL